TLVGMRRHIGNGSGGIATAALLLAACLRGVGCFGCGFAAVIGTAIAGARFIAASASALALGALLALVARLAAASAIAVLLARLGGGACAGGFGGGVAGARQPLPQACEQTCLGL